MGLKKESWDVNSYGIVIMETSFVLRINRNTKFRISRFMDAFMAGLLTTNLHEE